MLDLAALVPYCGIPEEPFFDRFAPACSTPEDGSESLRQSLGFNLVFRRLLPTQIHEDTSKKSSSGLVVSEIIAARPSPPCRVRR